MHGFCWALGGETRAGRWLHVLLDEPGTTKEEGGHEGASVVCGGSFLMLSGEKRCI